MLESLFNKFRKKKDKTAEENPIVQEAKETIDEVKDSIDRMQERIGEETEKIAQAKESLTEKISEAKEGMEAAMDRVEQSEKNEASDSEQKNAAYFKDTQVPASDAEEEREQAESAPRSFLDRLKKGLSKTRDNLSHKIDQVLSITQKVDEEMMEDLEDILIASDMGVDTTMRITDALRRQIKLKRIKEVSEVKKELAKIIKELMQEKNLDHRLELPSPSIILVVGVNGAGKTTLIGKLAHRLKKEGRTVQMAAADTFRAAAIEQLAEWARRADVDIIAHNEGSDPAAVIYDAIASAHANKTDVLICDTAGRLQNKQNLMKELDKINRIITREYPGAKKEVLLVVDGTTGQNALMQAKEFKGVTDLSGVVITKLDGTAKGGMVIPLELELDLPVKLIGIGEKIEDLVDFNVDDFIDAIVD